MTNMRYAWSVAGTQRVTLRTKMHRQKEKDKKTQDKKAKKTRGVGVSHILKISKGEDFLTASLAKFKQTVSSTPL